MKIGIIALRDGKSDLAFPIINEETETMETWDTEKEAREFSENNMLCQYSEVILIDLETGSVIGFS